jgi:RNA recognition motif-containing protein
MSNFHQGSSSRSGSNERRAVRLNTSPYTTNNRNKRQDSSILSRRLYVGNLSYDVTWKDLKDHFRQIGTVARSDVILESSGRSKGCGLIEYAIPDHAKDAIELLHNTELKGRMIFVREDRELGNFGANQSAKYINKKTNNSSYPTSNRVISSVLASNPAGNLLI